MCVVLVRLVCSLLFCCYCLFCCVVDLLGAICFVVMCVSFFYQFIYSRLLHIFSVFVLLLLLCCLFVCVCVRAVAVVLCVLVDP